MPLETVEFTGFSTFDELVIQAQSPELRGWLRLGSYCAGRLVSLRMAVVFAARVGYLCVP